jgi:hypothetical protein
MSNFEGGERFCGTLSKILKKLSKAVKNKGI